MEGESELVSRYNLEYRGFRFTCLFLAEYLRFFWIFILMKKIFFFKMFFYIFFLLLLILIRAVLPRYKFNQVLSLAWRPINLFIFYFFF